MLALRGATKAWGSSGGGFMVIGCFHCHTNTFELHLFGDIDGDIKNIVWNSKTWVSSTKAINVSKFVSLYVYVYVCMFVYLSSLIHIGIHNFTRIMCLIRLWPLGIAWVKLSSLSRT